MKKGLLLFLAVTIVGCNCYASTLYKDSAYEPPIKNNAIVQKNKAELDRLRGMSLTNDCEPSDHLRLAQLYLEQNDEARAMLAYGRFLFHNAYDESAMSDLKKQINTNIKNNYHKTFFMTLDARLKVVEEGGIDSAQQACQQILKENPNYTLAKLFLAKMFLAKNNPQQAISILNSILATKPYAIYLDAYMGDAYTALGQIDLAIKHYEIAIPGDLAEACLVRAKLYLLLSNNKNMTPSEIMQIIYSEKSPNEITASDYCDIAETVSKLGDLKATAGIYKQAIAINQKYERAYESLANTYIEMNENILARNIVDMGRSVFSLEKENKEALTRMLVKIDPDPRALADKFYSQGYYEDVICIFEVIGPETPDEFVKLAESYNETGRYFDAIVEYKNAINSNSRDPLLHYNLALIQEKTAEFQDAKDSYSKALELNSNYKDAKTKIAKIDEKQINEELDKAIDLVKAGNINAAKAIVEVSFSDKKETDKSYFCRSLIYKKMGDTVAQLSDLNKAYAMNSSDPEVCLELAKYHDLTSPEVAVKYYKEYIKLQKDDTNPDIEKIKARIKEITPQEQTQTTSKENL